MSVISRYVPDLVGAGVGLTDGYLRRSSLVTGGTVSASNPTPKPHAWVMGVFRLGVVATGLLLEAVASEVVSPNVTYGLMVAGTTLQAERLTVDVTDSGPTKWYGAVVQEPVESHAPHPTSDPNYTKQLQAASAAGHVHSALLEDHMQPASAAGLASGCSACAKARVAALMTPTVRPGMVESSTGAG